MIIMHLGRSNWHGVLAKADEVLSYVSIINHQVHLDMPSSISSPASVTLMFSSK